MVGESGYRGVTSTRVVTYAGLGGELGDFCMGRSHANNVTSYARCFFGMDGVMVRSHQRR